MTRKQGAASAEQDPRATRLIEVAKALAAFDGPRAEVERPHFYLGKPTHHSKPWAEATPAEQAEAQDLARLRLLANLRDQAATQVIALVKSAAQDHGTSALRLADVAHLSNGTSARWLRCPSES